MKKPIVKESIVKRKIAKFLKQANIHYSMPPASVYGKAGVADFICCVSGRYVAIEAKSSIGKQTALQKQYELSVVNAGGLYLLIDDKNLGMLGLYLETKNEDKKMKDILNIDGVSIIDGTLLIDDVAYARDSIRYTAAMKVIEESIAKRFGQPEIIKLPEDSIKKSEVKK